MLKPIDLEDFIKNNPKKKIKMNITLDNVTAENIRELAKEEDMMPAMYIKMALEHYWDCYK